MKFKNLCKNNKQKKKVRAMHSHNSKHHAQPIHHCDPYQATSPLKILQEFSQMGVFGGGSLGKAFDILLQAKEEGATIFMSLAGAMIPGGMKKVLTAAMREGLLDVLVTTGANVTHDLIEAFGKPHLQNVPYKNDLELYEKGIDRVYDSFVHNEGFGALEDNIQPLLMQFIEEHKVNNQVHTSSHEFLRYIGEHLKSRESFVRVAFEENIPIFVPVLADSVLGLQIWLKAQFHNLILDEMRDLTKIQELFHESEKSLAFILGGGVPKNYMLQASLMSSKQYEYGIQVTMDRVETGGLSGATLEEAVSWGKFTWKAPKATVYADTTIVFPLIVAAYIEKRRNEHGV